MGCAEVHFRRPGAVADGIAADRLQVVQGQTLFLAGPSGSGKSTRRGLPAGMLLPSSGKVQLPGTGWAALSASRRDAFRADHVGYIFQQLNLLPDLSVQDNVLRPFRFCGPRCERATQAAGSPAAQAQQPLAQVGLDAALRARPAAQLSVGKQQPVATARADGLAPRA